MPFGFEPGNDHTLNVGHAPGRGHVAEGVNAARAAMKLARHHRLDMPITEAVYRVLFEELPVRRAVEALLAREPKSELA